MSLLRSNWQKQSCHVSLHSSRLSRSTEDRGAPHLRTYRHLFIYHFHITQAVLAFSFAYDRMYLYRRPIHALFHAPAFPLCRPAVRPAPSESARCQPCSCGCPDMKAILFLARCAPCRSFACLVVAVQSSSSPVPRWSPKLLVSAACPASPDHPILARTAFCFEDGSCRAALRHNP